MPYLTNYPLYCLWPNEVVHTLSFSVPANGGTPTNQILPPGDSIVSNGSGVYTITFADAPYYQCVSAISSIYQSTITDYLSSLLTKPTNGSGTTSTLSFFTVNNGTVAEPTHTCDMSLVYRFRKTGVP